MYYCQGENLPVRPSSNPRNPMESDQLRMVSWNLYIPCVSGGDRGIHHPITFRWATPGMSTNNETRGHHIQIGTFGISGDDLLRERWIDANFWNEIFTGEPFGHPVFFETDLKGVIFSIYIYIWKKQISQYRKMIYLTYPTFLLKQRPALNV